MLKVLILLFAVNCSLVSCVTKPRGVPISKLHFYKEGEPFNCLDGSGQLPWSKVNDDYCDCRDASDEPGTSACSNGFFFCENKMHQPELIPSSRVGDGICDCCDGSDEYSGLVSCKNTCEELGKAQREANAKRRKLIEEGHKIYHEYVKQVDSKMTARKSRVEELDAEIESIEEQRSVAEKAKSEAEEPEKAAKQEFDEKWKAEEDSLKSEKAKAVAKKAFEELDQNNDKYITADEIQSHTEFDIDQNGEVTVDEAKEYMNEHETIDETKFVNEIWKNIQDIYKTPEKKDEDGTEEESDEGVVEPPAMEPEPPKKEYDEATKALIEAADKARQAFNELDEKYNKLKDEKRENEELLNRDYGPNNAFFILAESTECYEMNDQEYTYRLCPFKEATQRGKDSGGPSLGHWGRWDGPEDDKYSVMLYENGQSCWNGPNRSTKVYITCGPENKLTEVSEPSRCEYRYQFMTPAACSELPPGPEHDEL